MDEARTTLPPDPSSAGAARRFVRATLSGWHGFAEVCDVAILLVSELVTNGLLHGGSAMALVLYRDGARLRVELHDESARLPARKHYSDHSATGRGLLLVDELSQAWGAVPTGSGKYVWFELGADAPGNPGGEASGGVARPARVGDGGHAGGRGSESRGPGRGGRTGGTRPELVRR